jgi:uncharacterized protein (TIGR02001 family)
MMNKLWVRTAVAAVMLAGSGAAMAEFSGNVTVVSDYLFDGISQTDNKPAAQVGLNNATESGVYFGFWGSNVDFNTESDIETDWYIGYGWGGEAVAFDAGIVFYKYLPDDDDIDYNEIYFGVTLNETSTIKWWYADDIANTGESAWRLKFSHSFAINDSWSIPIELTHTAAEDALGDDFNHVKVGVATSFDPVNVELSLQMTDADDDVYDEDIYSTDGNVVLSVGFGF